MKKSLTLKSFVLSVVLFLFGLSNGFSQNLIISEVADPGDEFSGRFVEILNPTSGDVDLTGWQIRRYANANTTSGDIDLSGILASGETYVVANNEANFTTFYGFAPDLSSGTVSGNGDDTYELFNGASVVDIYGAVGTDGTGEPWEYENSHAVRKYTIVSGNTVWTASEWTISAGDIADMTPGTHTYAPPSPNDNNSSVNAEGVTQPAGSTLSSLTDDVTEAVHVFQFNIKDSAAGDGLPTKVKSLTFKAGPDNTANWGEDIGGAYIIKNGDLLPIPIDEPIATSSTVAFPIQDGGLEIADGSSQLVDLFIWVDSTTTDNVVVQAMIDAAYSVFIADPSGSVFSTVFDADITGNAFTIVVEATDLWFVTQPTDVLLGQTQPPFSVAATDENGNVDIDNAGTDITLTYSGTGTVAGTTTNATATGVAEFADLSYDTEEAGVSFTAAGGSLNDAASDTFAVVVISLPYAEDFNDGFGYVSTYSVSGDTKEWVNGFGTVAQMNGFNSGELEEDWLILPAIDFSTYEDVVMKFETWYRYGSDDADNYLKLMYSTDYAAGSPADATWTELSFNTNSSEGAWEPSGAIDLSMLSSSATIAFKYHYNSGSYRQWHIDDILIEEVFTPVVQNVVFTPEMPLSTDAVSVTADITDNSAVDSAYLIWYTNDAPGEWDTIAMENTSGDEYATAMDISAQDTDTVFIHIFAVDDEAGLTEYTDYYTILPTPSIYEIQYSLADPADSPYSDKVVKTTGIVTANTDDGFFIQDSASTWNGLYVYDFGDNVVAVGDSVVVAGEVVEYFNLTEISGVDNFELISSGNTVPEPLVISPDDFGEPYEGVLVQLQDVKVTAERDEVGFGQFKVSDGIDTVLVDDDMIRPDVALDSIYTLTGIITYSFGDFKLLPRDISDVDGYIKGNIAPVIGTVSISPESPTEEDIVTLSFTITDDAEAPIHIDSVSLMYGTTEGVYDMEATVTADGFDATVFFADIPAMSAGTMVYYEISVTDSDAENPLTSSITGSYEVTSGVGVSMSTLSNVSLFPNPNDGAFTLTFNSTSAATLNMSVLDMQGRVIEARVLNVQGNRSQHNIVLEKAERGLYIIRLENDGNTLYKRLLIE